MRKVFEKLGYVFRLGKDSIFPTTIHFTLNTQRVLTTVEPGISKLIDSKQPGISEHFMFPKISFLA